MEKHLAVFKYMGPYKSEKISKYSFSWGDKLPVSHSLPCRYTTSKMTISSTFSRLPSLALSLYPSISLSLTVYHLCIYFYQFCLLLCLLLWCVFKHQQASWSPNHRDGTSCLSVTSYRAGTQRASRQSHGLFLSRSHFIAFGNLYLQFWPLAVGFVMVCV